MLAWILLVLVLVVLPTLVVVGAADHARLWMRDRRRERRALGLPTHSD